jgi:hypothetical protein
MNSNNEHHPHQTARASLAARLAALIDGPADVPSDTSERHQEHISGHPSTSSSMQSPTRPSPVPAPPSPLDTAAHAAGWTLPILHSVARHLFTNEAINEAQHPGLTRNRIRPLLPDHLRKEADTLLHWLDAAQLLAPPVSQMETFRHPRPLTCKTTEDLVRRLAATPYPRSSNF